MNSKRVWVVLAFAVLAALAVSVMVFVLPISKPSDAWYAENIEVDGTRIVVREHEVKPGGFVLCVMSHLENHGILTIEAKGIRSFPFAKEPYHVESHESYIFNNESVRTVRTSGGLVLWENTSRQGDTTDETDQWENIESVTIYSGAYDFVDMDNALVITDRKTISKLVESFADSNEIKEVPSDEQFEGINSIFVDFGNGVVVSMYEDMSYGNIGSEMVPYGDDVWLPEDFHKLVKSLLKKKR